MTQETNTEQTTITQPKSPDFQAQNNLAGLLNELSKIVRSIEEERANIAAAQKPAQATISFEDFVGRVASKLKDIFHITPKDSADVEAAMDTATSSADEGDVKEGTVNG